jgi:methylamine dehydrogenase accessory protein MauD
MMNTLVVSNLMLWIVVLVLVAVVFALVRQIGVLYERVAPAGALMAGKGLKTGEQAPVLEVQTLPAVPCASVVNSDGKSTLLFSHPPARYLNLDTGTACDAQKRSAWLEIILASDGEEKEHRECELQQLEPWLCPVPRWAFHTGYKLPFAAD